MILRRMGWAVVAPLACSLALSARAAAPVEIEVVAVAGAPLQEMQTWSRVLGRMGLTRVTLRGARGSEQPGVTADDYGGVKRYKVVALLSTGNKLILPGGRFALQDAAKLERYLKGLPEALDEASIERGRFGLTKDDFATLFEALTPPVVDSTVDVPRNGWLERVTRELPVPCEWSPAARRALSNNDPIGAEYQGLSRGTALAIILRQEGLALFPQQRRRDPLTVRIDRLATLDKAWPVGWKPGTPARQMLPQAYKATTIEIANYSLAQALAALEGPLGAEVVYDPHALAQHKIDPEAVMVKVPRKKLLIKSAVDTCLSQARLAGEFRVDEAGQPLYWITRFGDLSPKAQ